MSATHSSSSPSWSHVHVAIMAGGGGTRFWPLSRDAFPKQFLPLFDNKSMLHLTLERISQYIPLENVWILTNRAYYDLIRRELPEIAKENILIEPTRKDTAAAIMLGAATISRKDPQSTMVVMSSDHLISPADELMNNLKTACEFVESSPETLCVFGIPPTEPAVRFGYLHQGEKLTQEPQAPVYRVKAFVEKPDLETAKEYLQQGVYLWNSGIFVWKVATIIDHFQQFLPKHGQALKKLQAAWKTPNWPEALQESFRDVDKISIDYGIMEKSPKVALVPSSFDWNDVGTWDALEKILPQKEGNTVHGRYIQIDSSGCIIHSEDKLIATIGMKDVVVVSTPDVMLVVPKQLSSEVKKLVELIREKGWQEYL